MANTLNRFTKDTSNFVTAEEYDELFWSAAGWEFIAQNENGALREALEAFGVPFTDESYDAFDMQHGLTPYLTGDGVLKACNELFVGAVDRVEDFSVGQMLAAPIQQFTGFRVPADRYQELGRVFNKWAHKQAEAAADYLETNRLRAEAHARAEWERDEADLKADAEYERRRLGEAA